MKDYSIHRDLLIELYETIPLEFIKTRIRLHWDKQCIGIPMDFLDNEYFKLNYTQQKVWEYIGLPIPENQPLEIKSIKDMHPNNLATIDGMVIFIGSAIPKQELKNRCILLPIGYNWELTDDHVGFITLVAKR